jgi:predicted nucleotidyltransferase
VNDLPAVLSEALYKQLAGDERVVAAYLFGSHAEGVARPDSDVDVALLFRPEVDSALKLDTRLTVAAELKRVCHRPVDVIALDEAPPLLRFQVLKHGRLLFDRDPELRARFQARAMAEYYDARPYHAFHARALVRRIRQEGLGGGYGGDRDALAEARQLSARLAALSSGRPDVKRQSTSETSVRPGTPA